LVSSVKKIARLSFREGRVDWGKEEKGGPFEGHAQLKVCLFYGGEDLGRKVAIKREGARKGKEMREKNRPRKEKELSS